MAEWKQTVKIGDIWNDDSLRFEDQRDQIVERLRTLKDDEDGDLTEIIDELAETYDVEEFDAVWSGLYDYADAVRIWIDIF
jgi:hypothetical protein